MLLASRPEALWRGAEVAGVANAMIEAGSGAKGSPPSLVQELMAYSSSRHPAPRYLYLIDARVGAGGSTCGTRRREGLQRDVGLKVAPAKFEAE